MRYVTTLLMLIILVTCLGAETIVNTNITANETWTLAGSPYIIAANISIYGSAQPLLTIEAGVEVRIEPSRYITVGYNNTDSYAGGLRVQGTSAQPVVFTSTEVDPQSGDWAFIRFNNFILEEHTQIDHAHFEYGGTGPNSMIIVNRCSPDFNSCTFSDCNNIGLDNTSADQSATFTNCTFDNCGSYPLNIAINFVDLVGSTNTFTNNAIQMIRVFDGTIDTAQTWANPGIPYYINDNVLLYYDDTPFTIQPGCELVFNTNRYLQIGHGSSDAYAGCLHAEGVTFRGLTGTAGEWYGIVFKNYSYDNTLTNCTIRDGGYSWGVEVFVQASLVTIEQCVITNSSGYGVQAYLGSDVTMNNTEISHCDVPMNIYPNDLSGIGTGNTYLNNADNRIELPNDTINRDVYMRDQGIPFKALNNLAIQGTESPTLTIQYGTEIQFDTGKNLTIGHTTSSSYYGKLVANGVTFTGQTETPGTWTGLAFNNYGSDESILNGCTIRYAGYSNNRAIRVNRCNLTITGCDIIDTQGDGIFVEDNSEPLISGNHVADCSGFPLSMSIENIGCLGNDNNFTGNGIDAVEVRSGTIGNSAVWSDCGVPYRITGNSSIYSTSSPHLEIQPGCEIQMADGSSLTIGHSTSGTYPGSIAAHDVLFTSIDNTQRTNGIVFNRYSIDEQCVLDHCTFEYAGGSNQTAVYLKSSAPTITDCTFRNNDQYGIRMNEGCMPEIADCTFTNNGSYPVTLYASSVHSLQSGNQYIDNGTNRIHVLGNIIEESCTWSNQGIPFEITGNIYVYDPVGHPILTVSSGCVLTFCEGVQLSIGHQTGSTYLGGLIANGVTFTALEPTPGYWNGITFCRHADDDNCILENCLVEYGGANQANVQFYDTPGIVNGCSLHQSLYYGIRCYGGNATPTITNSYIANNQIGIHCESNGNPLIGGATGNANAIMDNTLYGVNNTSTGIDVDATYNWWGSADGPTTSRTGDSVSDHVLYDPWLTTPLTEAPSNFDLLSPANEDVCDRLDILFNWNAAIDPTPGDSVLYRLEIRDTPELTRTVLTVDNIGASTYRITGDLLDDDSEYWWRVVAFDNQGHETNSNQNNWSFTTFVIDPPNAFSLVSPANQETIELTSTLFQWEAATDPDPGDSVEYTVLLDSTAAFSDPDSIDVTETHVYSPFLRPGNLYYWKVVARDSYGITRTSAVYRFYVDENAGPRTPATLEIEPTGNNLLFTWETVPGADLYHVFRSQLPYSGFVEIGTSPTNEYTDTDIDPSQNYFYYIIVEDLEYRWSR